MKVVFRIFPKSKGGEVIALLCNTAADCNPGRIMSYMHVGQHGEADRSIGSRLRLATEEEFTPLKQELERIYETKIEPLKRLVA